MMRTAAAVSESFLDHCCHFPTVVAETPSEALRRVDLRTIFSSDDKNNDPTNYSSK
jgi:hypothetical protein